MSAPADGPGSGRGDRPLREYLVTMEVVDVDGVPPGELEALRAAESRRAGELAAAGTLVRLWRPAGTGWRNVGLWRAEDDAALEAALASLPFAPHLRTRVEPLAAHPNDPGR
ncbi:muconolactone Delta-isomerase family protein [Nocardioides sp. CPCC 205120]|uniref:muconolactone Delta-isomerase family protein n=1 Tax=Nocardioides sp. CPCC 205120 TaxID=3406462 RepID=UPI003B50A8AA